MIYEHYESNKIRHLSFIHILRFIVKYVFELIISSLGFYMNFDIDLSNY